MDPEKVQRDLSLLYPPFADLVKKVLEMANRETRGKYAGFVRWGVFESYRPPERQRWLYAQGRTRPGPIVTYRKSSGLHGLCLAADIVWYDAKNAPHWDGPVTLWNRLGHAVRANGLVWGGNWDRFADLPHVEPTSAQQAQWIKQAARWTQEIRRRG